MPPDPVQDYILSSESNFQIAAAVADSWQHARDQIITGFLDRLEQSLLGHRAGWQCERYGRFLLDPYAGFEFYRRSWKLYAVALQCQLLESRVVLGVKRDENLLADKPRNPKLLQAIKPLYPSATSGKWWEARALLRSPASNWNTPDILWQLHTDPHFLNDVAQQLLALAHATEKMIDSLCK